MKKLSTAKKIWISAAHGLFLFILLWYINNTSFSTSLDEGLTKKFFIVEDLIFPGKAKISENFVFIDVSSDIGLIKDPKSLGSMVITDRRKLADFFKVLADNDNHHQFVFCDVYFDYPSDDDKLLLEQISRCKKIIFPFPPADEASGRKSVIKVPSALASYETLDDKFSKFKLVYNDTVKTIPVTLFEKISSTTYRPGFFYFNSYSPRYYIRQYQLEHNKFPYFKLGNLLPMLSNKELYAAFLKDKFIVLGNFQSDVHSTPIGKVPGSLILIDSYLSLKMGRNHFNVLWVAFMLISLALASYVLFFLEITSPKINVSVWIDFIIHNFLNKVFSFLGICTVIVFVSEILFSLPITISPLFLYLTYVDWAISFFNKQS